jgi:hypothetical protein
VQPTFTELWTADGKTAEQWNSLDRLDVMQHRRRRGAE